METLIKKQATITGMDCKTCAAKIEKALNNQAGVSNVSIDLDKATASIQFDGNAVSEAQLSSTVDSLGYDLHFKDHPGEEHLHTSRHSHHDGEEVTDQNDRYICPMRCEGDKTYNAPGVCPVCNMHLVPVAKS